MKIEECFKVAYVSKTHGLAGEVTISLLPECPDLSSIKSIFVEKGGSLIPYFIKSISIKGDKAYVRFEDVDSIDKAAELKSASLYLAKTERPKLSRGEFYNDEIVGFEVEESAHQLGKVTDIMEAGPNRFLVIDHNGKEVLIPINGPFIKSVNKSKKRVIVELPEGFLDI